MATGTPINPAIKSEILQKVREEGLSVCKAAQIYNVNYRTIGGLTAEVQRPKKISILLSETEPGYRSKFARPLGLTRCPLYAQPARLGVEIKTTLLSSRLAMSKNRAMECAD